MITVIQPDPWVSLDSFQRWFPEHEVRIIDPTSQPLPAITDIGDGLLLLGGRQNALDHQASAWIPPLQALLRDAYAHNVAVLGICLGHQILADTFGGTVCLAHPGGAEEGVYPISLTAAGVQDPYFASLSQPIVVQQSHNDCVLKAPAAAEVLATSATGSIQAFRLGTLVGVQFHPEASAATMQAWAEGEHGEYEAENPGIGARMFTEVQAHAAQLEDVRQAIATAFKQATCQ